MPARAGCARQASCPSAKGAGCSGVASGRPPTEPKPAFRDIREAASGGLNGSAQRSTIMAVDENDRIINNPKFQELVRERSSFAWTLSIVMLVIYYGFILLVAFGKGFLATKIGGGVIISAFVLTGIYTQRANSRFDELTENLTRELTR